MRFCAEEQHGTFLRIVPFVDQTMIESGIILVKYWLEVSKEERARRLEARIEDPLWQWKLSPMDIESWQRWDDYTRARDEMFLAMDTPESPWYTILSEDKKKAQLNCIAHLLSLIPVEAVQRKKVKLPKRSSKNRYDPKIGLAGGCLIPERY